MLATLALTPGPLWAASLVAPALDGSGTLRIDGTGAVDRGGGVVDVSLGGATYTGAVAEDDGGEILFDRVLTFTALVRPFPAPLELGLGMTDFRRHPTHGLEPVIGPGPLAAQARIAGIPDARWLAIALTGAFPVNRIEGLDDPYSLESRVALSVRVGPLRPMGNVAWVQRGTGVRESWVGGALRVDLPVLGADLSVDAQLPSTRDYRTGVALGIPVGAGVRLVLDAWRQDRGALDPTYEGTLLLSMRTSADGPGIPFNVDRDEDGVPNPLDACPRTWGDAPDGCPAPAFGMGCDCPFDDMEVWEIERLVGSLAAAPQGQVFVVEVRVPATGDAVLDYELTEKAMAGARQLLVKAGVPQRNIMIIGRRPINVAGVPLLTVRQMPLWKAEKYREDAQLQPPER